MSAFPRTSVRGRTEPAAPANPSGGTLSQPHRGRPAALHDGWRRSCDDREEHLHREHARRRTEQDQRLVLERDQAEQIEGMKARGVQPVETRRAVVRRVQAPDPRVIAREPVESEVIELGDEERQLELHERR